MITVLEYTKDNVEQGDLKNICQPKTFTWIDVFEPTQEEIKQIADVSGTLLSDLKMALDPVIWVKERWASLLIPGKLKY